MMNKIAISMSLAGVLFTVSPAMAAPRSQTGKAKTSLRQKTSNMLKGRISRARAGASVAAASLLTASAFEPGIYHDAAVGVEHAVQAAGTDMVNHPVFFIATASTSAALANPRVRKALGHVAKVIPGRLIRGAVEIPADLAAAGYSAAKDEGKAIGELEHAVE
jgi:hypothetical protein